NGKKEAINKSHEGTKASAYYYRNIKGGESVTLNLRLSNKNLAQPFEDFDAIFENRKNECNEFYDSVQKGVEDEDLRRIQRQAYAGMMWGKQFYYFNINEWLEGDPGFNPPESRKKGRNHTWKHLNNSNIISMPDKWE